MCNNDAPLVHAIETSGRKRMPSSYRAHSVSDNQTEVDATRETYLLLPGKNSEKRLGNFDTCNHRAWFVRHEDTGAVRVAAKSCKLRWCPLCAKKRSYVLLQQVLPWAENVSRLKFFTLTLKHSTAPLRDQINNLYKFFQAYRKLKFLKDNIRGGVWFFQIKKSSGDGLWHPHLHCLLDSNFMDRVKLSQLWQRTTLTSMVVDIKGVKDVEKVAEYVGRYSARPATLAELEVSERVEVMEALHGRRLFGSWGNAKGMSIKLEKPDDADKWKHIGFWSTVHGCLGSDENAKKIFDAWRKDEPLEVGVDMKHIEYNFEDCFHLTPKIPPENQQLYLQFSGSLPF